MNQSTINKLLKMNTDLYESQALDWHKTRTDIWEKPVLDFISKIKLNSHILDLGCGNARLLTQIILSQNTQTGNRTIKNSHTFEMSADFTSEVNRGKINYTGIDLSKKLIEINKKKYLISRSKNTTNNQGISFKIGNGLTMKYKNKFDYIISIAVLHHAPSEKLQQSFLQNCYNSLLPNGILFLSVWNRWQKKYIKYMNKSKPFIDMQKTDIIVPWKNTKYKRFIHCFTSYELKNLAQKTGFKKIQTFYANKYEKTTKQKGLNIYLIATK